MAISDSQKLDYLWKKIAYTAAKTDTLSNKLGANEAIASPMLNRGDLTWMQASLIPDSQPSTSDDIVTVYKDSLSNTVECDPDNTATQYRTWKTNLTDWIGPQFGASYLVKVFVDTAGSSTPESTGTRLFPTGSGNNDEWFFDYQAGVLNFIGTNLPNGINFSGKSIFIVGARYSGNVGVSTVSHLENVANVSFSAANVFIDSSTKSSVSSGSDTIVSSFDKDTFNYAKLMINVKDLINGQYQSSEVLLVHDGTDVKLTEYAIVHTSDEPVATFNASIDSSNVNITTSASSANNTISILRFLDS